MKLAKKGDMTVTEAPVFVTNTHSWGAATVRVDLKGKHKQHCLCYTPCARFDPENEGTNCEIADELFELCQLHGIVAPVWECPEFVPPQAATG